MKGKTNHRVSDRKTYIFNENNQMGFMSFAHGLEKCFLKKSSNMLINHFLNK